MSTQLANSQIVIFLPLSAISFSDHAAPHREATSRHSRHRPPGADTTYWSLVSVRKRPADSSATKDNSQDNNALRRSNSQNHDRQQHFFLYDLSSPHPVPPPPGSLKFRANIARRRHCARLTPHSCWPDRTQARGRSQLVRGAANIGRDARTFSKPALRRSCSSSFRALKRFA